MASNTYGAIKLSTAEDVGAVLKKKTGSADGYKPKEWADTINLMGLLPIRTASGTIAHFEDGADDVPLKSLTATITPIQEGTGDPSPSNSRPISGTSVLNVTRAGKNLFDKSNDSIQINGYISASKIIADNNSLTVFTKCKPNTTYTVSKTAGKRFVVCWYDDVPQVNDTLQGQIVDQEASSITITTGATAKYLVAFVFNSSVDTTITKAQMLDSIQIEEGSTATTYKPYTGSSYPIALGRTVYGGSAEIVGGTGEETWERIKIRELGTFSRYSNFFNVNISGTGFDSSADYYCEVFNNVGLKYDTAMSQQPEFSLGYSGNSLKFRYDSTTDPTQFLNDVGDYYIVHKLATPTDFTFTGQPINSYLGVNNLYTDSGEVLDVDYRADINLLISELGG